MQLDRPALFLSLFALLTPAPAAAQVPALEFFGTSEGASLGSTVERIGDVNGDGLADFALGAPSANVTFLLPFPVPVDDVGRVTIHSGSNGEELWSAAGPISAGSQFGAAITDAGDVNGDGRDDVLIGAPTADGLVADSGAAYLYSGSDGVLLRTFLGSQTGEAYGSALCAGELDGDSTSPEAAIGAPNHDIDDSTGGFLQEGRVEFVDLATGAIDGNTPGTPYAWKAPFSTLDRVALRRGWGSQLAYIGDFSSIGRGTIVATAPFSEVQGDVLLGDPFQAVNAGFALKYEPFTTYGLFNPPPPASYGGAGEFLGSVACALPGDPNGDGVTDWATTVPGADTIRVYTGAGFAPSTLFSVTGPVADGVQSLADAGDRNGDGTSDLVFGIPGGGTVTGRVAVASGGDGFVFEQFDLGDPGNRFGSGVAGADMTGNGTSELWIGARSDDTADVDAGAVYVFGDSLCPVTASWSNYGTGLSGALSVPSLTSPSNPILGESFPVEVGPSTIFNTTAFWLLGGDEQALPLFGGTLLVDFFQLEAFTLTAFGATLNFAIPDAPNFCGADFYLQVLALDNAAPEGVAFSQGMEITLGN